MSEFKKFLLETFTPIYVNNYKGTYKKKNKLSDNKKQKGEGDFAGIFNDKCYCK